jgi:hypothetical protein
MTIDLTDRYNIGRYMRSSPGAWTVDREDEPVRALMVHHTAGWYGPPSGAAPPRSKRSRRSTRWPSITSPASASAPATTTPHSLRDGCTRSASTAHTERTRRARTPPPRTGGIASHSRSSRSGTTRRI